jgi:hypothetical protein
MEHRTNSNGWKTFLENWGGILVFLILLACLQVFFFSQSEREAMGLLFCCERGFADFGGSFDCLREDSGLSEREVFYVWGQVRAGGFCRILSAGVADVFARCGFGGWFAVIEAMRRRNSRLDSTLAELMACVDGYPK